jgi:hypothetical protein
MPNKGQKGIQLIMMNFNLDADEIFRLVSFPSFETYLSSISEDNSKALVKAEDILHSLQYILTVRQNELNFVKLKHEFGFTLVSHQRDELQDFTTAEVAEILNRCPASVRNYIRNGQLECYRTANKDIRITRRALENFMATLRNSN